MSISVNDFGKAVVAAGLMSADEVKSIWDGLPAEARPKNAEAFGKLLEVRGKLTAYQAEELAAGNGPSLVLGDYVILAKIGAGGMGQVFKAQHRRMKRLVAIKLLPPAMTQDEAAVKRFQREVEAAAKLSHPNIVTAHDAGCARGVHYLVMEYVEGKDLSHLVKSQGPLPVADAVNYITQAARGLAYAHHRGVVHRDIKPANLLLDGEGTVKILDMGLARFEDNSAAMEGEEEALTQSGQVMGTVDYMAPEQAFDTRQADARADVYSLGCSLYRLLTAENIYAADSVMQKFMAHREKPIPSLCIKNPSVSDALNAVFQKMVAKLPEDRYHPTSDLVTALEACLVPAGSSTNALASQRTSSFVADIPSRRWNATGVDDGMTAVLGNQLMRSVPESQVPRDETFNSSVNDRTQRGGKVQNTMVAGGKKPPWQNPLVLSAAGAGALLIVLLGIWVIVRDKDGKPVAKVQVPEGGSLEVTTTPPKTSPAAISPQITSLTQKTIVDLLKAMNTDAQGKLRFGSKVGKNGGVPHFFDAAIVPDEYVLEFDLERAVESGHTEIVLVIAGRSCSAILASNAADTSQFVHHSGLAVLDGLSARDEKNPTMRAGNSLNDGHVSKVVCEVRKNAIRVSVDAKIFIDWTGDPSRLSPHGNLARRVTDKGDRLGIVQWAGWLTVHRAILRPITAAGPAIDAALKFVDGSLVEIPGLMFDAAAPYTMEVVVTSPSKSDKGDGKICGFHGQSYLSYTKGGKWRWVCKKIGGPSGSGTDQAKHALSNAPHDAERTHLACVHDGTTYRLYYNGKLFQSTDFDDPLPFQGIFSIGGDFYGIIDELRISKVARYKAEFPPPTVRFEPDVDTVGLYHFDDAKGDVLTDSSGHKHHGKITGAAWVKADGAPLP